VHNSRRKRRDLPLQPLLLFDLARGTSDDSTRPDCKTKISRFKRASCPKIRLAPNQTRVSISENARRWIKTGFELLRFDARPQPVHHHRIALPVHPLSNVRTQRSLTPASALPFAASCSIPGSFQPIQCVSLLLVHSDSFHPSALRLSRGTFYFAQTGTFHFAAAEQSQWCRNGSIHVGNLIYSLFTLEQR
jgi:hypothetical protein